MTITTVTSREFNQDVSKIKHAALNGPVFITERILYLDVAVAQRCARLHVPNPRSDRDAIIAATALVHGMTIVTRNVSDFDQTGVEILNPWGR